MVTIITENKFVIALKARIPRNPHLFNGMGNILSAIGMAPLNFNGYRNVPPFFIGYRNGEGGLQPPPIVTRMMSDQNLLGNIY